MTPAEQIAEFCAQITPARKRLGLSTTELAAAVRASGVKVHQSTISRVERGLHAPDWETAIGLSSVLDIPMPTPSAPDDSNPLVLDPTNAQLMLAFDQHVEEQRRIAMRYLLNVAGIAAEGVRLEGDAAAHEAADRLDAWDGFPSSALGGMSPGGVVRDAVHEAARVDPDSCPSCERGGAA